MVPTHIQRQYEAAMATPNLTREEAEKRFPELLDWLRERVPLAELIRDTSGVELEPLSADYPNVLVGRSACPSCHGPVGVRV